MASPFRFGLERVRELRVHAEDRAKEAFAAGLGERARGAALLESVDVRLHDARQSAPAGAGTGADLQLHQAWVERLERSRADAALRLDALDQDLERRRAVLTDASRGREVLDRLRDRRAAEHAAEAQRREGAALDEVAIQGHRRRRA
jgi:flagellar FliJ protein